MGSTQDTQYTLIMTIMTGNTHAQTMKFFSPTKKKTNPSKKSFLLHLDVFLHFDLLEIKPGLCALLVLLLLAF